MGPYRDPAARWSLSTLADPSPSSPPPGLCVTARPLSPQVRDRLIQQVVEACSDEVWGGVDQDPILQTFFKGTAGNPSGGQVCTLHTPILVPGLLVEPRMVRALGLIGIPRLLRVLRLFWVLPGGLSTPSPPSAPRAYAWRNRVLGALMVLGLLPYRAFQSCTVLEPAPLLIGDVKRAILSGGIACDNLNWINLQAGTGRTCPVPGREPVLDSQQGDTGDQCGHTLYCPYLHSTRDS